jgi:uridine phosphorylase
MTFPNHPKKYSSKEICTAKDWNRTRGHTKRHNFPEKYIICYFDYSRKYFLKKYKSQKIKLYQQLIINIHDDIGLVMMSGAGASQAAMIIEELIALGGKYIINTGTAGGLQTTGIVVCDKALCDEGTSQHYTKNAMYSYPDEKLTELIIETLKKKKLEFSKGPSWTTDALYKETKEELEDYKKQGIYTVEMEASAIFTVAKLRKAKVASIFVVSDVLGHKKYAKFHRFDTKKGQKQIIDIAYETLKEIKK